MVNLARPRCGSRRQFLIWCDRPTPNDCARFLAASKRSAASADWPSPSLRQYASSPALRLRTASRAHTPRGSSATATPVEIRTKPRRSNAAIPSAPGARDARCRHVYAASAPQIVALSRSNVTQFVTRNKICFELRRSGCIAKFLKINDLYGAGWRRERDSNPRYGFP